MHVVVENASELCAPTDRGIERRPRHTLVARNGRVAWTGPRDQIPESLLDGAIRIDANNGAILPALVDCHTHLVFGGDRIEDFSSRARGETYAQIAARGGGILTTVNATRAATEDQLARATRSRLLRRLRYGIATTEIKSGYGLTVLDELKMLRVIASLRAEGYDLEPTLLGAHTIPKDVDREVYVRSVIDEMIPEAARQGLARFVDVFVETHAFTVDEARRIFLAGKAHGLVPRIHADQLSPSRGAELAAEVGAASADHLEHVSDAGLSAMRGAGVVATLLPGALLFLGQRADRLGRRIIDAGVDFAVATDANPGSSPLLSLPLAATFATTQLGLSVEESIYAITKGAARALRRQGIGALDVGSRARFVILSHPDSRALVYAYGEPVISKLVDERKVHDFEVEV
ncbi:MAG: imidazolonepropionase [Deltaproteobacteria bacterium]|nr:imidazolonepropionase [Deltaproteobacteria bacterium]